MTYSHHLFVLDRSASFTMNVQLECAAGLELDSGDPAHRHVHRSSTCTKLIQTHYLVMSHFVMQDMYQFALHIAILWHTF